MFDSFSAKVSVQENFDRLLVPSEHSSRSLSETFYFDKDNVLRTHTTCHDIELIKSGQTAFLLTGDCYRKDTIDKTHYPVFHQADGVRLFAKTSVSKDYVLDDMKSTVYKLITSLFGDIEHRWNKDFFPFTDHSLELEIKYKEKWMEILGGGILLPQIMESAGKPDMLGWAFGLGLERLAMALFDIPDIRLFHSTDARFLSQFESGEVTKFQSFSKFPACYKDVSFWGADSFSEKQFSELVRLSAGDLAESVTLIDTYQEHDSVRSSRCYRVKYRSFSRNLRNDEVDAIHEGLLGRLRRVPSLQLR